MNPLHCLPRHVALPVVLLLVMAAQGALPPLAPAQVKSPAERLRDLEDANRQLQERLEALEKEIEAQKAAEAAQAKKDKGKDKEAPAPSDSLLTIGGVELKLGGRAEILLVDPENEDHPVVGSTDNPDIHFELDRLRLEPVLLFSKAISLYSQIDFEPNEGDTSLQEMTARFNPKKPVWWFDAEVQVGLDDRFIRPDRRTKIYPMAGTAVWRRESIFCLADLTFGDKDGPPDVQAARGRAASGPLPTGGSEGFRDDGVADAIVAAEADAPEVVLELAPFDLIRNPGELHLFLSIGNGYALGYNEIGNDGASFNDIVSDVRDLDGNLSLRELGAGIEYRRVFGSLGELRLLGFYYNDELSEESLDFLQTELTLVDGAGNPQAGYGLGNSSRTSLRFGGGLEYFLPTASLVGGEGGARAGDGLYLLAQYIRAADGDLRRNTWFAQASWRLSFPERVDPDTRKKSRGLVVHRYFRSIEPLVRYGELDVNIAAVPEIPGLWDRKDLLVGGIIEVTSEVFFKAEYVFNWERTGASSEFPGPKGVSNNEFLLELLLQF